MSIKKQAKKAAKGKLGILSFFSSLPWYVSFVLSRLKGTEEDGRAKNVVDFNRRN